MLEEGRRPGAPPHGLLLAAVVGAVVLVPFIVGDGGEAITSAIADTLSPIGLPLLPILLLLTIHFLSSDLGSVVASILSTREPESIHRVYGSPVRVALFLLLIMVLLYNRVSVFGGQDNSADCKDFRNVVVDGGIVLGVFHFAK